MGVRFFLAAALCAARIGGGEAPFALGCVAAAGPGAGGIAALLGCGMGLALFLDFASGLIQLGSAILIAAAMTALQGTKLSEKRSFAPVCSGGMYLAVKGIWVLQSADPAAGLPLCLLTAALCALSAWGYVPLLRGRQPEEEGLRFLGLTLLAALGAAEPAGLSLGGIGVMTFTSFFALSFMGKSSFTSKMMLKDMLNEDRTGGLFRVILNILFVTLFIEGIGAYFIYMDVRGSLPGGTQQELFYAMFHAVSAFCNAGISTLSGNMYDPLVADKYNLHFWIAMLIIFGGLGFPIVFNYLKLLHHLLMNGIKILIGKQKHYIHTPRIINVHTYIVVISTLILLITGTAFYLFFEYDNTLGDLPLRGKLANAFLGAVTPRTAGFNVADMATLAPPTLMLTLILMVIGAAPMSTGGGLKVTTVFVALVTTLNAAREKDKVEVRKREIAPFAIRRAFAIIMMYFMWVAIATWVLSYTEKGAPLFSLLFEVVSALSTVGLSIDYTPHLTPIGKIIIISTMLVGRIGVLAFLVSFCKEYTKKDYTYPQENILM